MTNFQTNGVRRQLSWLTPENAVLVLPIVGGAVLAGIIAISAATPLLVTLRDQKIKLDALLSQQIELPALGQRLRDLSKQQVIRQRQQDLLLSLLSGTNELTTFLTELDQLALTAGVAIETTGRIDSKSMSRFLFVRRATFSRTAISFGNSPSLKPY